MHLVCSSLGSCKAGKFGPIASFRLKEGEVVVSIADVQLLKESGAVRLGSRPKHLFDSVSDIFGEDNLQVSYTCVYTYIYIYVCVCVCFSISTK